MLAVAGKQSSDNLFYLYALLPLAVGFVAEQLRVASAQTILDQRGLEDAQAVGELPAEEQRAVVAEIVRREIGVMALLGAGRRVPRAARGEDGARLQLGKLASAGTSCPSVP